MPIPLTDFAYQLPEQLIAQHPLDKRDRARLMVLDRATGRIGHDVFANIGKYLPPKSVLVVNNSKVIPARLLGRKQRSDGKVEIFLLRKFPGGELYEALLRPLRKIREGDKISFNGSSLVAQVIDKEKGIVRFNRKNLSAALDKVGHIPLPPYIRRPDDKKDRVLYQTVYAKREGSVAAPTAGLHFTKALIKQLQGLGHSFEQVTLHVNYATFKPVEEEDITQHKMHSEDYAVSPVMWRRINKAREEGRPVVAVGTTSCRVLEAAAATGKLNGETDIFIYPGYRFEMTDVLVTNFHLPHSSLLMLVQAFAGKELTRWAYAEAIREKYRFYSYGDGMIIK